MYYIIHKVISGNEYFIYTFQTTLLITDVSEC